MVYETKWTQSVPEKNGWYWVKGFYGEQSVDIFYISYHNCTNQVFLWIGDMENHINPSSIYLKFYGPLECPE